MRIAGYIEHPKYKITVFNYNLKYIIKIEAGPMEQVFKIGETEVAGVGEIKKILDKPFMEQVKLQFDKMYAAWDAALKRQGI